MPNATKIGAVSSEWELVPSIQLERATAVYTAGESIVGLVAYQAAQAVEDDGISLYLSGSEVVTGVNRQPILWSTPLVDKTIPLNCEPRHDPSSGTASIPFELELDAALAASVIIRSPSIGGCSNLSMTRSYSLCVVFSLRNSTEVKTAVVIQVVRNPHVVWLHSLPSASFEDSTTTDPVGSPLARCCCWRRGGDTSISATIHNRTVDLESGVVHVRTHVLNRSPLVVNSIRLCLIVDMSLREPVSDAANGEDEEASPPVEHSVELLNAINHQAICIEPGGSAHVNLEMDIHQLAFSLLTEQDVVLQPTIRTKHLEIQYSVRVEVGHANGGSTISLDLPLVLVPLLSDVLPPLDSQSLEPIEGRESQRSTEQEDDVTDIKSIVIASRVSSMEVRPVQLVSVGPLNGPMPSDIAEVAMRATPDR